MKALKKGQSVAGKMTVKAADYFAKRREIVAIIYELRALVTLPRIEVKVADANPGCNTIGLGFTDDRCAIVIDGSLSGDELYAVVLHEIVHTAFKFRGHVETCPLMASALKRHDRATYLAAFLSYST